jgi:dual specificity tyrosine-phosphorylation-regulated kinase 2/3/4
MGSMQKQSDASLRNRNHLPTIAGSPSVTVNSRRLSKEATKDVSPNILSSAAKETPTKIPRISSRTSAISTPPPKSSLLLGRRTSVNTAGSVVSSTIPSPTPGGELIDEFGVIENGEGPDATAFRQISGCGFPSTISRVPRQSLANNSTSGSFLQRRTNRDSASLAGLRKSSTGSVTSIMSVPPSDPHRFSALSPSKGLKLFSSKGTLSSSLLANSSSSQRVASPSSSRQSLSTPSPVPRNIDEEELLGDEEILNYIRRQQTKKLASGASQQELDDLLKFPEPLAPGRPSSPASKRSLVFTFPYNLTTGSHFEMRSSSILVGV